MALFRIQLLWCRGHALLYRTHRSKEELEEPAVDLGIATRLDRKWPWERAHFLRGLLRLSSVVLYGFVVPRMTLLSLLCLPPSLAFFTSFKQIRIIRWMFVLYYHHYLNFLIATLDNGLSEGVMMFVCLANSGKWSEHLINDAGYPDGKVNKVDWDVD